MGTGYVFDPAWQAEQARLRALENLFDPATTHYLAGLGVGPGWRCLEVGGGAGSIARWLARQVAPGGQVVATDVDTRFLDDQGFGNLEVRRHDITGDPLEAEAFDLAHERVVLMYLPQREQALARMVEAVRPGGWVVAEAIHADADLAQALRAYTDPPAHAQLLATVMQAAAALVGAAGADAALGPRLPRLLHAAGLEGIGGQVHSPLWRGGAEGNFFRLTLEQLAAPLARSGLISAEDFERALEVSAQPGLLHVPLVMVTAWGQRPAASDDS
jgi:SAM-dependent methyltransferase